MRFSVLATSFESCKPSKPIVRASEIKGPRFLPAQPSLDERLL
jgi:hypothetical protein